MAKALRTVGVVVAVVGIVATAGALAFPAAAALAGAAATAGGVLGVSAATLSTIGTIATLAGAAIGAASAAFTPKPSFSTEGNPLNFQTNPQSGLPYAIGRTRMSGLRIFGETSSTPGYTKAEDLLWFGVLLSAGGAIQGIEQFTVDNAVVAFDGNGQAAGPYAGFMAQRVHLGGPQTSALALTLNGGGIPGWGAQHKLSGITHALWALRFDKEGEKFSAGIPEPAWIGKWAKAYDPRKDSTYPGGSGPHRPLNEATYEWTRNPALHALTWALGRWQNGKRVLGIGAPVTNIRITDFVEAANVADANGWNCGGVEWSTDSKWTTFKRMLQAGGAEPTMTGAMIGCRVNTPRVAIATVQAGQLHDSLSIATTRSRRDRFNTVIPRYRSEDHDWEVISGSPVSVPAYVAQDGGQRTKEIDFPLVQHEADQAGVDGNKQAGELAAYEIVNSREAGPISFTVGPQFIGVKTGDVINLNVPDEGLVNQPILIRSRSIDPVSLKITFEAETETASKHDFALGRTTTPPPPFGLTPPDLTPPQPDPALWDLTAGSVEDESGNSIPAIFIVGVSDYPGADQVVVRARKFGDPNWYTQAVLDAGAPVNYRWSPVEGEAQYEAEVAYKSGERLGPWLNLGTATTTPFMLGGVTTDYIAGFVQDYSEDNDANGTTPPAAAGVTVTGVNFTDGGGQAIVSFNFSASTDPAAASNIDGYRVGILARTSSAGYTYNPADDRDIRWDIAPPDLKTVRFGGVAVDQYITAIVLPFRNVRSSTNPETIIYGPPAQSSPTSPYRQAASPNFTGRIDGATAASIKQGAARANVAITDDNTIATGRVLQDSILEGAINDANWSVDTSGVQLGLNDLYQSNPVSVTSTGERLVVRLIMNYDVELMDPMAGEVVNFTVRLWAEQASGGTDYYSDTFTITEVWNASDGVGLKRFGQKVCAIEGTFEGLPTGAFNVGFRIQSNATCGLWTRSPRYVHGSDMRAQT